MKFTLDNILVDLLQENNNVRVNTNNETVFLINQSTKVMSEVIKNNFEIVNSYYKSKILNDPMEHFDTLEINQLSFNVVLHYLHMYNLWKNTYKNKRNQNLVFDKKDFNNLTTADLISFFYKKKSPDTWKQKTRVLLGLTKDEFEEFYKEREKFYNK